MARRNWKEIFKQSRLTIPLSRIFNAMAESSAGSIEDVPLDGKEYALKDGVWVDISEELEMARWFAETDRVITTLTNVAGVNGFNGTLRRVRVGNIYMYRIYIENTTAGSITIPAGSYVLGTVADYPELSDYEFSNQMGAPLWQRTAAGAISYYSSGALLVQPNGIILHLAGAIGLISNGIAVISEATRSQMGPWA